MKLNLIREKLQESIQNKFRNMSEIFNAGGRENNKGFKFTKESWKNKKYEIHYEIQYNKESDAFYIRIDCHFIPYSESKNLMKAEYELRYGKDEIKKRLGRSPDKADALALTFAEPVYDAGEPRLYGNGRVSVEDMFNDKRRRNDGW